MGVLTSPLPHPLNIPENATETNNNTKSKHQT